MAVDQAIPDGWEVVAEKAATDIPDGWEVVTAQKSDKDDSSFFPDDKNFVRRVKNAAIEMPVGMLKQAGRLVQAIPGVAAATDKLYGLPKGASKQAMQPANLNEKVGGYLGDVALIAATGGAEAGPAMLTKTAGYVSNPTVAGRAIAKLGDAARFTGDVASLVKANISTGGPLTASRVADLITKYGKDAVKLGIKGTLGIGAYEAFKHLF